MMLVAERAVRSVDMEPNLVRKNPMRSAGSMPMSSSQIRGSLEAGTGEVPVTSSDRSWSSTKWLSFSSRLSSARRRRLWAIERAMARNRASRVVSKAVPMALAKELVPVLALQHEVVVEALAESPDGAKEPNEGQDADDVGGEYETLVDGLVVFCGKVLGGVLGE